MPHRPTPPPFPLQALAAPAVTWALVVALASELPRLRDGSAWVAVIGAISALTSAAALGRVFSRARRPLVAESAATIGTRAFLALAAVGALGGIAMLMTSASAGAPLREAVRLGILACLCALLGATLPAVQLAGTLRRALAGSASATTSLSAPRWPRGLRLRLVALAALWSAAPGALAVCVLVGEHGAGPQQTLPPLAAFGAAVAAWTARELARSVGEPLREIAGAVARMGAGDLRSMPPIVANDELGELAVAFVGLHARMVDALTRLRRAGLQIGTTTGQIVASSTRYEEGACDQAGSLNQTSATTEQLARSARQIAENAGSVAEIARRTLAAAQLGQESAVEFADSMDRMRNDNRAIADAVARLDRRVQQIGRIVGFITGIADKSDLLALNADLEGTKAADVGRGFSLVAAEMRRLAENVLESTQEIEGLIDEIREATSAAVGATESGLQATESGVGLTATVAQSLKTIVDLAARTSDSARSISLATQQQQSGTTQLAEAMADILRITDANLAATRQVTSVNADLSSLASELQRMVERFRI